MLLSRPELIAVLFRETDRAQRMRHSLAVIHFGVCNQMEWPAPFGTDALEGAIREIAKRIERLLRCYDSVGRVADDELLLILPGCSNHEATMMAKRLRAEAFSAPIAVNAHQIHLKACFGTAASRGRSPLVLLREAEGALEFARAQGAGAIEGGHLDALPDPAFFVPVIESKEPH